MATHPKVICKVLIDQDEYLKLKDFEHQIQELNHKKKKIEILPTNPINQHGEGISLPIEDTIENSSFSITTDNTLNNIHFNDHIINIITKTVPDNVFNIFKNSHFLNNTENNTNCEQSGKGFEDTQRPLTEYTTLDVIPPPSAEIVTVKSQLQDQSDNKKLLSTVPTKFHSNASKLLEAIKLFPMEISFNSNGELFIDSKNIPNANFFQIFPALYQKSHKFINGLSETITKLSSLNLNHLFRKGMLKVLKRPKKCIHSLCVHDKNYFKTHYKYWWYLGDKNMETSEFSFYFEKIPFLNNYFLGVYTIDQIPINLKIKSFFVANLDPHFKKGSHWIGFVKLCNKEIEIFDSFGLNLNFLLPYL